MSIVTKQNNLFFSYSIPYTCLKMATHSGKTVKLNIVVSDCGDTKNEIYRLNSKDSAVALYRSITEHHAFYRCDSVRPAVKEQVARDFFDTIFSWFHEEDQNYIFDTERTCREAYDHARRTLYNFGSTAVADMVAQRKDMPGTSNEEPETLEEQVYQLKEDIRCFKDAFHCPVCRDSVVDVVLQCGHLTCSSCGEKCEECPLCRVNIITQTKLYLPINLSQETNIEPMDESVTMEHIDEACCAME